MTALLCLLPMMLTPSAQAMYEVDRQTGQISLVAASAGPGLDGFGSPDYSHDEQMLAFDATGSGVRGWEVVIWSRADGSIKLVGQGNYPNFLPDDSAVLVQTLYDGSYLSTIDLTPPHERTSLEVRRYSPELSPDGRFILTSSTSNEPDASSIKLWEVGKSEDTRFKLPKRLATRPEFVFSPREETSEGKPVVATVIASLDLLAGSSASSEQMAEIVAFDLYDKTESRNYYLAESTVLFSADKTHQQLHYPTGALTNSDFAFRYTRPDGGYSIAAVMPDKGGEPVDLVVAPKGIDISEIRMSPSGRYVAFKSNLFHRGPVDGRFIEIDDLLPPD